MTPNPPWVLACVVCASGLTYAAPAHADRQAQCIEEFERAQRTRKRGRLLDSRREFRLCAAETCPAMVRKDCTDALASLGTTIPSLRPRLEDANGNELRGFTLELDGAQIAVGPEPIEVDPGEHRLVFSLRDRTVSKRIEVRAGELALPVVERLEVRPAQSERADAADPSAIPTLAWVFSGVALAGTAGFVGFGLAGRSTQSCKGSCSDDEIDTLHRQYLLADVSLGVAVVSGGLATWLFLSTPEKRAERGSVRPWLGVAPSPHGGAVWGGARF